MLGPSSSLRRSKAEALAAKDAFLQEYASGRKDRAVGVGLNRNRDDWAVKVYARTEQAGRDLPSTFKDFEVEVEVTGPVVLRDSA